MNKKSPLPLAAFLGGDGSGGSGNCAASGSSNVAATAASAAANAFLADVAVASPVGIVFNHHKKTVDRLWSITEDLNILYKENWTRLAAQEVQLFQVSIPETQQHLGQFRDTN
ncbi:GD16192 [Drosophila simulans]|uniref:GD16192 n=1 Tax=Drosophila simulans TaxID=7240 RepID=B4R5L8_DROSI|nr:GD16192 [Drosophila simulans]